VTDLDALRLRAHELGVETFYWDNEGHRHETNPESMRRVVEVLEDDYARSAGRRLHPVILGSPGPLPVGGGVEQASLLLADGTRVDVPIVDEHVVVGEPLPIGSHALSLSGPALHESSTIVVAPDGMPRSAALSGRAGLFAPAYALWEHDAPLPGFGHLAAMSAALPALGIDVLVTLPLYAGFFDEPFDPSPYAPVSRLHWNEVYLDDDALSAAPQPPMPAPPPAAPGDRRDLIDWRALAKRRRAQLLQAAAGLDGVLGARVQTWLATRPDVADYARFRAKVMPDPTDAGHPGELIEASHHLAQFLAHEQLSQLEAPGSAAFALDLPIGSHPAGFETWSHPDLFAPAIAIGAPPDALFSDGQNWGFPPQLPGEAERTGFALWRDVIRSCGQYASMLRIDHVLGIHRLWWIPQGMSPREGVYVRYPRQALMSVIATEAALAGTTIVGEDLGTVPQEIIDTMAKWSMLGLHAERLAVGEPTLPPISADTVACVRTHDMDTFAAMYAEGELASYRNALQIALGRPIVDSLDSLLDATLTRLASSDAYLALGDLDDLIGETTPHNVPGKVLPTIWRRRLQRPTSETLADPQVQLHLATLARRATT